MQNKIEPKTLSGFMELLPDKQILFNNMIDIIRDTYEKFGFLPIDTPIIESSDVLLAKAGGETERQIYRFNKGENDLSLRFDLTVPLAKYVSINNNNISFPFRRYQIGKVYRGERPQKGRFREFYQCDIDIIGDGELDIINDAEIPSIIFNTFSKLGFGDFTIHINNRKLLNGLFQELDITNSSTEVLRIIDKIEKIGKDAVSQEIEKNNISKDIINKIFSFIEIKGSNQEKIQELKKLNIKNETFNEGLKEIEDLVKYIRLFGVPEENYELDFTIARGLDYYTGTVYETFLNEYKQLGSVCSGGRYDNLAEFYTDKNMPGVGISIGLTRLFYQLDELGILKNDKTSISKVLVIPMSEDISKAIEISTILRNNGINTELYTNSNKKMKAKFKYADKLSIPYVIVIGEDEINNNKYTLKNMQTGEQKTIELQKLIDIVK